VVVGGQERLAEGSPVTATLVQRRPVSGREESAVVDSGAAGQRDSGTAGQKDSGAAGRDSGAARQQGR